MSVISKKFADELVEKEMRDAYLDAQTRAKLAQQIRTLRAQRALSQEALGTLMGGKPQANIARLEDRNVGRYTLTTLLELASAFDVGLVAKFVPYEDFLVDTGNLSSDALKVHSFNRECLTELHEDSGWAWQYFNPALNIVNNFVIYEGLNPVAVVRPTGTNVVVGGTMAYDATPIDLSHVTHSFALPAPWKPSANVSAAHESQSVNSQIKRLEDEKQALKIALAKSHREKAALQAKYDALCQQFETPLNDERVPPFNMSPYKHKPRIMQ